MSEKGTYNGGPQLPESWKVCPLGELVENLDRQRVPVNRKERAQRLGDVPYYGATGQAGWIDAPLFDDDLVLLGEDGVQFLDPAAPKAYMISGPSWVNNHAHVLRPDRSKICDAFLCLALNAIPYQGYVSGTTRLKLTQAKMNQLQVPCPPLDEQRRIVAVMEAEFARIDAIETEIDAVGSLEAQFQASLLRDGLLGRLAPGHENGTSNPVDGDMDSDLPYGWQWSTLGRLGVAVRGVTYKKEQAQQRLAAGLLPLIRATNISECNGGQLLTDEFVYVPNNLVKDHQHLMKGDLVIASSSGSLRVVGKAAPILDDIEATFGAFCTVFRPNDSSLSLYLRWFFQSRAYRDAVSAAAAGSNINNLKVRDLLAVRVPAPPPAEREEIVKLLDREMSRVAEVGSSAASARGIAEAARRSLLHQAFTGELRRTRKKPLAA